MRTRSEAQREKLARAEKDLEEWQIKVPNDPINENVICSSMAVDAAFRARAVKELKGDWFYSEDSRAFFAACEELERQKLAFDPAVIARLAPDLDQRFVEQLYVSRSEVAANIEHHLTTLRWDHKRAQVTREQLAPLIQALQNPLAEPAKVQALGRALGAAFEETRSKAPHLRDTGIVIAEMMEGLRRRRDGEAYYPVGITGLDYDEEGKRRLRPGMAPGMVSIITGKSGAGKTTFAGHVILGQARQKRRCLVGAWEVRAPMTMELITTLSLKWDRGKLLDARSNKLDANAPITDEELEIFHARAQQIRPWIVFVENPFRRGSVRTSGRVTNDDYLDILEEHLEASGCSFALLDLFDRCLRYRKPDDEQEALWRVAEFTDALRMHTTLVHQQLLKGEEVRKDGRPSLNGLKGSSAYVDVGATIFAPHIPARFKAVPNNTFEVHGLKQRFAEPFAVEFDWNPATAQLGASRNMGLDETAWGAEPAKDGSRPTGVAAVKRRRS